MPHQPRDNSRVQPTVFEPTFVRPAEIVRAHALDADPLTRTHDVTTHVAPWREQPRLPDRQVLEDLLQQLPQLWQLPKRKSSTALALRSREKEDAVFEIHITTLAALSLPVARTGENEESQMARSIQRELGLQSTEILDRQATVPRDILGTEPAQAGATPPPTWSRSPVSKFARQPDSQDSWHLKRRSTMKPALR